MDHETAVQRGGQGGRARAEKLTPEQRSEIARKASAARWAIPRERLEDLPPDAAVGRLLDRVTEFVEADPSCHVAVKAAMRRWLRTIQPAAAPPSRADVTPIPKGTR